MSAKMISLSLAAALLLGGAWALHAQPQAGDAAPKKEKRTISTSGTATIRVRPDHARVYFGVQSVAPTVKDARNETALKVKKVLDAITALKIPDLKMKTTDVQVDLIQAHAQHDKLPLILGYRVTNSFTVLIKDDDAEKLGANASKVLDTALEAGANIVSQVQFFKGDVSEIRRQALAKAVQDGLANAKALASGAGIPNVELIGISGEPQYHFYGQRQMFNVAQTAIGGESGGEMPVVAGELEVTCTVNVTCTF